MIDPLCERLISLATAAKLCPRRRGGKRPHVSCLYRWTVTGCRSVLLESVQVGGTRCTSREALARFFVALTAASGVGADNSTPTVRTAVQRRRSYERAAALLERDGI